MTKKKCFVVLHTCKYFMFVGLAGRYTGEMERLLRNFTAPFKILLGEPSYCDL